MSQVVALAGGVGGAKLALGLARLLPPDSLTVVVNTADDDTFHGLHVSPDLDTVTYTLAGVVNPETGWGRAGDTFNGLEALGQLGAETWFKLGDRDLALHVQRTQMLREGHTLSEVARHLCDRLGVRHAVVPMSDQPVRTVVDTDEGSLAFQDYFVRRRCEPRVRSIRFNGVERATPSPWFEFALERASAIVICPSNPFLSVAPILAVPGVRARIEHLTVPKIAVSPIVGGRAIKGPAAKLIRELTGEPPSCAAVAKQYRGLATYMIIDHSDESSVSQIEGLGMKVELAPTVMNNDADKVALARTVLSVAGLTP